MTAFPSKQNHPEQPNDVETDSAGGAAPDAVADESWRQSQPQGSLPPEDSDLHTQLDGDGTRAGQPGTPDEPASSTQPANATRELTTSEGALPYRTVAERLAVNIARWLDALLDQAPEDIFITPDWIREIHRQVAGELFPDWAGRFRSGDVQVGTHFPPDGFDVPVHVANFCLDLDERLRHLSGSESIAELLAWTDWRFQWIHPFKDFNGRVGRILLVALCYKLGLPPIDPAVVGESEKTAYFHALRAADAGDLGPLSGLWLERLSR